MMDERNEALDILHEQVEARGGHDFDNGICGLCAGPLVAQGHLGNVSWYKCRDCGSTACESVVQRPR